MSSDASWPQSLFASFALPSAAKEPAAAVAPADGTAFRKILARTGESDDLAKLDASDEGNEKVDARNASIAVASAMQAVLITHAPVAPPACEGARALAGNVDPTVASGPSAPIARDALLDPLAQRAPIGTFAAMADAHDPLAPPAISSPLAALDAAAEMRATPLAMPLATTKTVAHTDAAPQAVARFEATADSSATAPSSAMKPSSETPPSPVTTAVPSREPAATTARSFVAEPPRTASPVAAASPASSAPIDAAVAPILSPAIVNAVTSALPAVVAAAPPEPGARETPRSAAATAARPDPTSSDASRAPTAKRSVDARAVAPDAAHADDDNDAGAIAPTTAAGARPDVRPQVLAIDDGKGTDKPLTHVNAPSLDAAPDTATAEARVQLHAAVVSAMNHITMRREASGHIELPELGRVEVSARPNGAEIDVRITAAQPDTAKAIHHQMPQIEADLRAGDIPLHQVTVGGEGGSKGFDRPSTSSHGQPKRGDEKNGDDPSPVAPSGRRVRIVL